MSDLTCYGSFCLNPVSAGGPKIFGFAEFLAGLALMVLAWTIADVRYRFRLRTTPIPLQGLTFFGMTLLGILTLATDLWRAQEWLVPAGPLTSAIWQALLGVLFLLIFLLWAWFAFIKPPIYGRLNSQRFARTLYRTILNGSPEDLTAVADELVRSVRSIIKYGKGKRRRHFEGVPTHKTKKKKVEEHANTILLLISDPRFCRAIVASSPATALAIFQDIRETGKYDLPVETFAKNIVLAAMNNKDSFLFHESEGYETGLLGYHKPLTSVMFGDFAMVENIHTLLDPNGLKMMEWDSTQWEAYCRIALLALKDYAKKGCQYHTYAFHRVKEHLVSSVGDLYQLNGVENIRWASEPSSKLRAVVRFIRDAVDLLDKHPLPEGLRRRVPDRHQDLEGIYGQIADLMFEVVFAASAVTSPRWTCWSIQHNSVWTDLFWSGRTNGPASRIIHFKFRRLMYDEIKRMNDFVNFKGAKILAFCLNVMGLEIRERELHSNVALHRAVLSWTKTHFAWVHRQNPRVAEACLVSGFTFDESNSRLVHTYPAEGLRREPMNIFFSVDRAPTQ